MMCRESSEIGGPQEAQTPWTTALSLTKPVLDATRRPMPRWVGWLLVSLPPLSLLGTWLVGRLPVFQAIAVILAVIAAWDWRRFFDRSRTMVTLLALSAGIIVSAIVAAIIHRPPWPSMATQSISVLGIIVLTLAMVQFYRSSQTVLTLIRGWLYAVAILAGITVYQRLTRDLPVLNGPFPSPAYLAASMVFGAMLMPIGFALEDDRRLRWAYPVAALMATWVVWTTHRSVAFGMCLALLLVWLATIRWLAALVVAAVAAVAAGLARSVIRFRWTEVGMEPPLDNAVRDTLTQLAWRVLHDSYFLGVGPGGLAARWPDVIADYRGPYSALLELASQYGLAVTVAVICAGLGVLTWCWRRLRQTKGAPLRSPTRAVGFWLAWLIVGFPLITSLQAQWLNFPLSALGMATLAILARDIESPQGRPMVWPATQSDQIPPPTS